MFDILNRGILLPFLCLLALPVMVSAAESNGLDRLLNASFDRLEAVQVDPFLLPAQQFPQDVLESVSDPMLLTPRAEAWQMLMTQRPASLLLELPTPEGNLTLQLTTAYSPLSVDFDPSFLENGLISTWEPGLYYKGVVEGRNGTLAALSFFDDRIVGLISEGGATWVVANLNGDFDRILLYRDSKLLIDNDQQCQLIEAPEEAVDHLAEQRSSSVCKEVSVQFDCDYEMYQDNGSSVSNTMSEVSAIFNVSQTIFLIDDIHVVIANINVFTSPDPYAAYLDASSILSVYRSNLNASGFIGDVAQLLSTRSDNLGGIGYLPSSGLCTSSFNYAFSNIWNSWSAFPLYSWTVDVITHEFGHVFSSRHTHWCGWSGGAIDNCYATEGSCAPGPPPTGGGGTIMSYCHLTSYGKDFTQSFGPQPGATVRNRINSASCLPDCPATGCQVPENASSTTTSNSVNVSWDAVASALGYQARGQLAGTGNFAYKTTASTGLTVGSLNPSTNYEWQVRAYCGPGDTSAWTVLQPFTTGTSREAYPHAMKLYPNPVDQSLQIHTDLAGSPLVVRVYDLTGRIILEELMQPDGSGRLQLSDLGSLEEGLYLIRLSGDKGVAEARFAKR